LGKRIIVRRRGRGGIFQAPTHRRIAEVSYPILAENDKSLGAVVKKLVHDPGRGTPLALITLENGKEFYVAAPEGLSLSQKVTLGDSPIEIGNILRLGRIPEGTIICNVEGRPGDGGKIAR